MVPPSFGPASRSDGPTVDERRIGLWSLVVGYAQGGPVTIAHVAAATQQATGVDGAAITLALRATPRETVYASDPVVSRLEELTLTLGEGPGVDASTGGPALVADLTASECLTRWPMFAPASTEEGIRAVFALPLQVGGIRLGVLALYRARPGALEREALADALLLADTACALLLDAGRQDQPRFNGYQPEQAGLQHPEVHQATGMVAVQLGANATVALTRLRGYAYAHDRPLRDVAGDVVARRLRFDPEPDGGGP